MLGNIQIFNFLHTSVFFKNCLFSEIKHKEQSHTSIPTHIFKKVY
jgi:hypothetical protein